MALTGGTGHLLVALAAFLGAHSLTNLRPLRHGLEARFGKAAFYGGYSLLSSLLLVWVVAAAIDSPTVVIWPQQPWMRWAPPLVMPFACQFWVLGMTQPNPFSIGPGARGFDPARPGILRLTRHPIIWGLGLWSGAHIVPNGHLAGLLLFVPLFVLCVVGPRVLDAKRRQSLGWEEWESMTTALAGPLQWRALLAELGWKRIIGGLLLYGALLHLHPLVIGLSPLP